MNERLSGRLWVRRSDSARRLLCATVLCLGLLAACRPERSENDNVRPDASTCDALSPDLEGRLRQLPFAVYRRGMIERIGRLALRIQKATDCTDQQGDLLH